MASGSVELSAPCVAAAPRVAEVRDGWRGGWWELEWCAPGPFVMFRRRVRKQRECCWLPDSMASYRAPDATCSELSASDDSRSLVHAE